MNVLCTWVQTLLWISETIFYAVPPHSLTGVCILHISTTCVLFHPPNRKPHSCRVECWKSTGCSISNRNCLNLCFPRLSLWIYLACKSLVIFSCPLLITLSLSYTAPEN